MTAPGTVCDYNKGSNTYKQQESIKCKTEKALFYYLPLTRVAKSRLMPPPICPDCGFGKYNKYGRKIACFKCKGSYKGFISHPTAKNCPSCSGSGYKASNTAKDCSDCQGTGKKLVQCDQSGCVNGYVEYMCKDDFHG